MNNLEFILKVLDEYTNSLDQEIIEDIDHIDVIIRELVVQNPEYAEAAKNGYKKILEKLDILKKKYREIVITNEVNHRKHLAYLRVANN